MSKKIYVVGGDGLIENMFKKRDYAITNSLEEADLIQFTGGSDVSPTLYHEVNTHSDYDPERDLYEVYFYLYGLRNNIPMAGICRGGQFLNVMSGGKMKQHVNGHAVSKGHIAYEEGGREVHVTSTHHQMMIPSNNGVVILTARETSTDNTDIEAVFYNGLGARVLCYQPHPEYNGAPDNTNLYFEFLKEYLGV